MTAPQATRVTLQGDGLLVPLRDEGRALDGGARADFERAMGASFGDVIVHSGPASTASTESWDAAAYTVGRHIVFNSGRYDPGTLRGRALLAHELTHVAQQRAGGGDLDLGFRMPGSSLPVRAGSAEADASHAGGGGSSEGTAGVTGTGIGVAMQSKTAERAAASEVFQYKDAGGTVKRVSQEEGERLRAETTRKLRVALLGAKDMAAFGRSIHDDHITQTQASSVREVFTNGLKFGGTVSNMLAGVVPPSLSMWHHPTHAADLGLAALERGDLKEATSSLRRATLHLDDAQKEWSTYIQASIGGAESFLEQARVLRRPLSALHGVLTEVAQIVDTGLWVVDEALAPVTPPGVPKGATPPTGIYAKIKASAAKAGLVDTNNGALSITGVLHKTFDESDKALATEPESDSILTENDMWQLGGQAGAQAGLAYVGVTEVKYLATALKIAGTVGAIKGVSDSLDHHRRKDGSVDGGGLAKDPDFWVAIGNLMITAIGHRGSRVGSKLVRILVASAPSLFAGTREFDRVLDAYALPEGPKRTEELRTAVIGLIRIAIQGIIQVASNRAAARPPAGGGPKQPAPSQGEPGPGTGAGQAGHQPETPAAGTGTQPKPVGQPSTGESAPVEPVTKAAAKPMIDEPAAAVPKPVVEEPAKTTPKPVVEEPTAQPKPVVEEPAAQPKPVVEEPTAQPKPVVEEPAAQPKPVVEEPTAQPKPVVEEPAAQPKPVVEEPTAQPKPVVEEPTSKVTPVPEEPAAKPKGQAEEPARQSQAPAKPVPDEPAAQAPAKPVPEEPAADAAPKPVPDEPAAQAKPATEEAPAKAAPKPEEQTGTTKPADEAESVATKKKESTPDEPATTVKSPAPDATAPAAKAPVPKPSKTLRNAWKRLKNTIQDEAKVQDRVKTAEERVAKAKKAIAEQAQKGKKPLKGHSDELETAERLHKKAVDALKKVSEAKAGHRANAERLEKHYELEKAWAERRFELWRERAREEIAARKAGTSKQHQYSPERAAEQQARIDAAQKELGSDRVIRGTAEEPHAIWDEKNPKKGQGFEKPELAKDPVDPIKDLSDAELAKLAATGETPEGFKGEIEHRIPQRVSKMLVDSGVPVELAMKLSKLIERSNLDPTNTDFHAGSDASRRQFLGKAPDGTPLGSMDARRRAPLISASDAEVAAIADALRNTPGVDLDQKHVVDRGRPARKVQQPGEMPGAPPVTVDVPREEPLVMSWREILNAEKERRGAAAKWDSL